MHHTRHLLALAVTAAVALTAAGCAVTRGQETVGAYIDDATITTQIKGRFVENTEASPRTAPSAAPPNP
jgi:hyperosmotically inducible periplasmic protein